MVKYLTSPSPVATPIWVMGIVFTLVLNGCSTRNETVEASKTPHQFTILPTDADSRLIPLMDSLLQLEEQASFMDSVINTYGYPLWEYAILGNQNGGLTVLAPLAKKGSSKVSGLIAMRNTGKFKIQLFDAQKPEKYGFSAARRTANARAVFIAADLFNQRAFDLDPAAINDPCMMLNTERAYMTTVRKANDGKASMLTARSFEGYIETCYYTTVCVPDANGNCIGEVVIHRDCVLSSVWVDDTGTDSQDYYEFSQNGMPAVSNSGSGQTAGPTSDCNATSDQDALNGSVAVLPPAKPITNVAKYLSCFSGDKGAIITFYADQPLAGSTDPYTMKEKVGHAFLTIEQFDNGRIIRRTLGYHPSDAVSPFLSKSSESILGDDSNEPYDVRADVSVTPSVLEKVITLIQNYNPTYHIESYNCTNFVLDIADACGVKVNRTKGTWVIGSGLNPANFGEDLKKVPGATSSGGTSKENSGNCN